MKFIFIRIYSFDMNRVHSFQICILAVPYFLYFLVYIRFKAYPISYCNLHRIYTVHIGGPLRMELG